MKNIIVYRTGLAIINGKAKEPTHQLQSFCLNKEGQFEITMQRNNKVETFKVTFEFAMSSGLINFDAIEQLLNF